MQQSQPNQTVSVKPVKETERIDRKVNRKFIYEMNRSSDVLDQGRGTLILSGLMPMMPPYVLRLHHTIRINTVHFDQTETRTNLSLSPSRSLWNLQYVNRAHSGQLSRASKIKKDKPSSTCCRFCVDYSLSLVFGLALALAVYQKSINPPTNFIFKLSLTSKRVSCGSTAL